NDNMKIILATHNTNKISEIKSHLKETKIEVISLLDLKDYEEIIEDGHTFLENAIIKAKAIAKKYNTLTLADDSGLEVSALNNEPGIYSSRYSGKGDYQNNLKLLDNLKGITNRDARFVCCLALVEPNSSINSFEGVLEGTIAKEVITEQGFGYDPVFIPNGYNTTLDLLGSNIKNTISHRANALNKFVDFIKK
ncbi:MAG TPA: RdgB/HAM1 family non-canonical purine NTP pyrophosphatase, partial [Haploplasma sp.]|nr:RdgB/HAM1 family non-canonical purine NTP pyrophosphatase [Haploplasma sp.]